MSKEPIELGLSVEKHVHHSDSNHSHGSNDDEISATRWEDRQFGTDSLSQAEQILAVLFVGGVIVVFVIIIISLFFNFF